MRQDGRKNDELRPVSFEKDFTKMADGSVLVKFGETHVLCTASISESVPSWLKGSDQGWVTAEYSMLPGSTPDRNIRKVSGRDKEIQRLIGRSLRSVVDLKLIPELSVTVDCDVLQADGGTRTASICGGYVALYDAFIKAQVKDLIKEIPIQDNCAAVSVGIIDGECRLDLPYVEDSVAEVDMNIVMVGASEFVEIQGTAEMNTFNRDQLNQLLDLASSGISQIIELQNTTLGR